MAEDWLYTAMTHFDLGTRTTSFDVYNSKTRALYPHPVIVVTTALLVLYFLNKTVQSILFVEGSMRRKCLRPNYNWHYFGSFLQIHRLCVCFSLLSVLKTEYNYNLLLNEGNKMDREVFTCKCSTTMILLRKHTTQLKQ